MEKQFDFTFHFFLFYFCCPMCACVFLFHHSVVTNLLQANLPSGINKEVMFTYKTIELYFSFFFFFLFLLGKAFRFEFILVWVSRNRKDIRSSNDRPILR